jgi:hypothetical protein
MQEHLIGELETLIVEHKLILWIHGNAHSYLVPAVSVCLNGLALQIEGDPEWKFYSAVTRKFPREILSIAREEYLERAGRALDERAKADWKAKAAQCERLTDSLLD